MFVTHDVDEALRIADRIVVMFAGRVQQAGTPLQVLATPATPYVAELLDTKDAVRRLTLLCAADAMRTGAAEPGAPAIDVSASLREALNALLGSARELTVTRRGTAVGALAFDDIRRAVAAAA